MNGNIYLRWNTVVNVKEKKGGGMGEGKVKCVRN